MSVRGRFAAFARTWGFFLLGGVLAAIGIARVDLREVDGLGLFSALPLVYFIGVGALLVGLVAAIHRDLHVVVWVHLVAVITVLHGLPGFVEPHPRFAVAWLHNGFSEQIASTGELLPFVDARFSWPGFFTTSALLQQMAGTDSLMWIVRFAPIVINTLSIIAVWNLARTLRADRRQANLAAALFVVLNWIGQDYFAPQAVAFLVAITLVIVVLKFFPASPQPNGFVARVLGAPEIDTSHALTGRSAAWLYVAVVATMTALVISHQLTPVLLGLTLVFLGLFGRIRTRLLGVILITIMAAWLAFAAEAYWLGHLEKLTGSVGDVGSVVQANVSERAESSSPERQLLLRIRLVLMGSVWLVAGIILVARRVRRTLDPALLAMFMGPFFTIAAQPYGGELLLRVALLTLPPAVILIATTLPMRGRLFSQLAISLGFVLVVPFFMLARFGNEAFEYITTNDLAVTEALYDVAPDDSVVYVQNRQTLISIDRVGEVRFRSLSPSDEVIDVVERLRLDATPDRHVYVLLTETQAAEGEAFRSLDPTWILDFADEMLEFDGVEEVVRRGGAVLLEVRDTAAVPVDPGAIRELVADE